MCLVIQEGYTQVNICAGFRAAKDAHPRTHFFGDSIEKKVVPMILCRGTLFRKSFHAQKQQYG